MKQAGPVNTSALPACKDFPRSPASWVGREPGRPSRSCQSSCSRSLDSSQLSCMCSPLGSGWEVERETQKEKASRLRNDLMQWNDPTMQTDHTQALVGSTKAFKGEQRRHSTQSRNCSHKAERPTGQAGSRNWLQDLKKSHNELFYSLTVTSLFILKLSGNLWLKFVNTYSSQCCFLYLFYCFSQITNLFIYFVPFEHMGWLILLCPCQVTHSESLPLLTVVVDVLLPVKALAAVVQKSLVKVDRPDHTLLAQVAHEELETNQGKDAQAEDSQDHHVRELLHRLDQGTHNGL